MTERSTLERKRLSDLHQIASQLGIKQYRKYRKPQLAEMIYKVATEQAASQQNETTTNGGAPATATQEAPVTTEDPNGATETPAVDGRGGRDEIRHDNYDAEASPNPKWVQISTAGEAAFRKRDAD